MVMRAIVLSIGFLSMLASASAKPAELPKPYKNNVTNFAYNLLFCDVPALFVQNKALKPDMPLYRVLHAGAKDGAAVRKIADEDRDSCTRMLAYDWLRARKQPVPAKTLLGVVIEIGSPDSLDTVAVYADGNVRYIDEQERLFAYGPNTAGLSGKAQDFLKRSRDLLAHLDPWKEPRVPAPPYGIVRITFLASSGLYFGDGELKQMSKDKLGGATVRSAFDLFKTVSTLSEK
jgi:hypothetical protein